MSSVDNPAACAPDHERAGLVSNQNPSEPYDPDEPYHSIACCERPVCQAKLIKRVAGNTNRQATFYSDAERGIE